MAKYSHRIQADRRTVTSRGMYIYGNTVRQAEVMPQRQEEPRKEHKKKKLDRQILKNRRKAMRMNPAYVMFLSIAAVAALVYGICRYVQSLQAGQSILPSCSRNWQMQKKRIQLDIT